MPSGTRYVAQMDAKGCLACDLTAGRQPLPGGQILDANGWVIEHCIGPLGVGTLLLKPRRHVTRVAALTAGEAGAQGPLLHQCASVIDQLLSPEQTYICLWSHAGGEPVHIHYVIQPVTKMQMADGLYGPRLQVQMFAAGQRPPVDEVERFADQARTLMNGGD